MFASNQDAPIGHEISTLLRKLVCVSEGDVLECLHVCFLTCMGVKHRAQGVCVLSNQTWENEYEPL